MMSSRYGVLGLLLFFVILVLGYENYQIWSSPSPLVPPKESGKKGEGKPDPSPAVAIPREKAPLDSFNVIAEKNIFNPERKEFSPLAAGIPGLGRSAPRPQITLYGVAIAEGYMVASIVNPGRPLQKGERETKTIKIGDSVGEYKLTQVLPDRIVMEAGEDTFEVLLHDPKAPKRRVEVRTAAQPATITTTSPTQPPPVPGATPVPTPGVTLPASPIPPAQIPRPIMPLPGIRGSPAPGVAQPAQQPPSSGPFQQPVNPNVLRGRDPAQPGGSGG
jgi:hypothetical protein